jgi:hypothetical protein
MDEAGFAQTPPNRGAWTPAGECHAATAVRGKRLNILAALLSTGALFTAKLWTNTTAELFAGFLGLLLKQVGKPLTIILDNASVHTAKVISPLIEQLKKKGLTLYFLPPYSPELNRIEILWRKVQVPVDGLQGPQLQNPGDRPRRHLCQIRPALPVDFLRGT